MLRVKTTRSEVTHETCNETTLIPVDDFSAHHGTMNAVCCRDHEGLRWLCTPFIAFTCGQVYAVQSQKHFTMDVRPVPACR